MDTGKAGGVAENGDEAGSAELNGGGGPALWK